VKQLNDRRALRERIDAKNALEAYVYEILRRCDATDGELGPFMESAERDTFTAEVMVQEEWVTGEAGEDAQKSEYVARLKKLQETAHKIEFRKTEHEQRDKYVASLHTHCDSFIKETAQKGKEHIKEEERAKIVTEAKEFQAKLVTLMKQQKTKKLFETPVFTCDELHKELQAKTTEWTKILSQPKPAPPAPPKPTEEEQKKKEEEDKKAADSAAAAGSAPPADAPAKKEADAAKEPKKPEDYDPMDDFGMDAPAGAATPTAAASASAPATSASPGLAASPGMETD
jgi:hypothetical protein